MRVGLERQKRVVLIQEHDPFEARSVKCKIALTFETIESGKPFSTKQQADGSALELETSLPAKAQPQERKSIRSANARSVSIARFPELIGCTHVLKQLGLVKSGCSDSSLDRSTPPVQRPGWEGGRVQRTRSRLSVQRRSLHRRNRPENPRRTCAPPVVGTRRG